MTRHVPWPSTTDLTAMPAPERSAALCTTARPRPVPSCGSFVVKNGSTRAAQRRCAHADARVLDAQLNDGARRHGEHLGEVGAARGIAGCVVTVMVPRAHQRRLSR